MEPPPPSEVWLDDRLVVADSPIDGRGLFFSAELPAGTVVIELSGTLVSTLALDALITAANADEDTAFVDSITIHEDQHLVLPPDTPAHFGNHSCNPTLWHVGPFSLATRKAVKAGEEATVDYGTTSGAPGFAMACRCGEARCRGVVTSDDWQIEELQVRYDGHWVPALQARIDARSPRPSAPDAAPVPRQWP